MQGSSRKSVKRSIHAYKLLRAVKQEREGVLMAPSSVIDHKHTLFLVRNPLLTDPDDTNTICSPLPFYITYESKVPYRPFHPHQTSFADASIFRGSIIFIPPPKLLRLATAKKDDDGDYHEVTAKDGNEFDIIRHQKEIKFEEREDPAHLILKINEAAPVRVEAA
jgi:hypothetical protein